MADVTISSLPLGTPSGSDLLPYSTGSNTLATPVSALFQGSGSLYLVNSTNPTIWASTDISLTSQSVYVQANTASLENRIGSYTNYPLTLLTNNTVRMRIEANGNVGIGTVASSAKLDVNGDVRATSYKTGSLPMFGANAFVHFNGGQDINGNASTANTERRIYAGGNVSSVLRNALGLYTIYFTTAMTSTEYLAVCSARHYDGVTFDVHCEVSNRLTTSCVVNVQSNYAGSAGATAYDSRDMDVMIIC